MTMTTRDGFVVRNLKTREEVHFVSCSKDGSMREKVLVGLLHRVDAEHYFIEDTREEA
jgi:hypothetical protein